MAAINRDKEGNIVSVTLETADGKKRTFRGNIAEDIAYQIHLKEITKNDENRIKFENFINTDEVAQKEIDNAGLSEITPQKPIENNEPIQREKIEPKYTVDQFADRIASGEKMDTPEDLQFYDNNKTEIENLLKEKAAKQSTGIVDNPENQNQNDENKTNEIPVGTEAAGASNQVPPETVPPTGEGTGDENTIGIHHEALKKIAEKMGLKQPERGTFLTPAEQTKRGRELLKGGADPEQIAADFKADGKVNADIISVARAHFVDLAKQAQDALDKFGTVSPEFKEAQDKMQTWQDQVIKPMGTEAGSSFSSLQGEEDLDTGSFVSLHNSFTEKNGVPPTPEQEKTIKELSDKVKELNLKYEDVQKKLTEALDKDIKDEDTTKSKKYSEKAKQAADYFRKLKTKPFIFKDSNGNEIKVHTKGVTWNDAVEFGAKIIEKTGQIADGVAEVIDRIKDTDWYKSFTDQDKENFANQLEQHYTENLPDKEAQRIKSLEKQLSDLKADKVKAKSDPREQSDREKELKDAIQAEKDTQLTTRFVDKNDNKFEPKDAKDIWDYAKSQYLDKGATFEDMLNGVATDLGLNIKQVRDAILSPKTARIIGDDLYRANKTRNDAIRRAKDWVETANNSKVSGFFKAIPDAFFRLKTFGHGTVGFITHAGGNIFRPSTWKIYWPLFFRQFQNAFGSIAKYEQRMENLRNEPTFTFWQRNGLAVDPKVTYDNNYEGASKFFGKIGKFGAAAGAVGDRGFNTLKELRFQLAEHFYNKLSNSEKSDPESAKSIAKLVNHSTGTSEIDLGKSNKAISAVFFAPKLEFSRWQALITDPGKAVATFANWKKATPAEKAAAKYTAKNAAEKITTYMALLGANSAALSLFGSNQSINYTDPTKSDWLKFKMGGKTLDATGGIEATMRFIGSLINEAKTAYTGTKKELREKPGDKESKSITTQLRYKLSPFGSTVADLFTGTDAMGRPLPYSNVKPRKGEEPHTVLSYVGESQLPIPIAEGIKETVESMKERGMNEYQIRDVLWGMFVGGVTGGTGAKIADDHSLDAPKKK